MRRPLTPARTSKGVDGWLNAHKVHGWTWLDSLTKPWGMLTQHILRARGTDDDLRAHGGDADLNAMVQNTGEWVQRAIRRIRD